MLLRAEALVKRFGGTVAVRGVDLAVHEGEILSIIGPNGAGKSVLFSLISGLHRPSSGRIQFRGEDITGSSPHVVARRGISRTFQLTSLFDELPVIHNLALGYQRRTRSGLWGALLRGRAWSADRKAVQARVLETLELTGLRAKATATVSTLSQVEQRRLAIGMAFISEPKLILLDEPTGGLIHEDTEEITRLIRKINACGVTICLIEHKMRMVMGLADRMVVLNHGGKIAEGTPAAVAANPAVVEAYLGRRRDA